MGCLQGLKLSISVPHVEGERELDLGLPPEEVFVSDKNPSQVGPGKIVFPESKLC